MRKRAEKWVSRHGDWTAVIELGSGCWKLTVSGYRMERVEYFPTWSDALGHLGNEYGLGWRKVA